LTEYLYRRNVVTEALRAGRRAIHRLWLQRDGSDLETIGALAREREIPVTEAGRQKLDSLVGDGSHQGVVLEVGGYRYSDLDEMLALARRRDDPPFLLLLDLLHGVQNIGSLLRTAEIVGVHGVIIQDRRAPDITPSTVIHSNGATEHLRIAQVTNLSRTIRELQERGVWIVGLDMGMDSQPLSLVDLNMPIGIVVGNEGSGLRRRVRESCDLVVELPMRGQVASLNAAAAGAVMLYMAWQARGYAGQR
jgi:23S rRNA (guanosine2251-2'-O)-methyltransferase